MTKPRTGRTAKPDWLKVRLSAGPALKKVEQAINRHCLHTVCQEALCPNRMECFGRGTATFLLLSPSLCSLLELRNANAAESAPCTI